MTETASIYTMDGDEITTGLQTRRVCNEARTIARGIAADRNERVELEDSDGTWIVCPDGSMVATGH